jgi:type IV pilus assembly protein PilB
LIFPQHPARTAICLWCGTSEAETIGGTINELKRRDERGDGATGSDDIEPGHPMIRKRAGRGAATTAETDAEQELVDDVEVTEEHGEAAESVHRVRLGELLLANGAVTETDIETALDEQARDSDRRLGSILVDLGALDQRRLTEALAEQHELPVADLRTTAPEPEALALLDPAIARSLQVLPLRITDDELTLVAAEPPSPGAKAKVAEECAREVRFVLAPPSDVRFAIDRWYRALADVGRFVDAFERAESDRAQAPDAVITVDEHSPVVQVVTLLLTQAARERASDVHIEPQHDSLRVRYRVDGALHEAQRLPVSMAPALASRIKIMADMNIVERRRPQDGQFVLTVDDRSLDVRVACSPTIWGEKTVMRLLDRSRSLLKLHELGMRRETAEEFSRLIRSPFGMVICAGPTGSGKTTTLYAALNEINDPAENITTIEDPVEYVLPSINQIQINEAADITFAGGLKAILRQDPDIILVGEMRDVETTRIAVQSALTGHLVLSSIHATDAPGALQRFLDMGIESFLVASSVLAVVGQRLVRRICLHCRVTYQPSVQEIAFYEEAGGRPRKEFVKGEGCNFCAHTGYSDRLGVYELLIITEEIRDLILHNAMHEKYRAVAISQGMRTLRDEGVSLVENDVTTIGEVVRRIYVL